MLQCSMNGSGMGYVPARVFSHGCISEQLALSCSEGLVVTKEQESSSSSCERKSLSTGTIVGCVSPDESEQEKVAHQSQPGQKLIGT